MAALDGSSLGNQGATLGVSGALPVATKSASKVVREGSVLSRTSHHTATAQREVLSSKHEELNISTRSMTSKAFNRAIRPTLLCDSPKTNQCTREMIY